MPLSIVFLELVCRKVGHYQRDDIAHDSSKVAPDEALSHNEIGNGTDEGEVPVIPQVDVHRTGATCNQQKEVDTQADRDNECTDSRVIGNGSSSRPTHIKHLQL